jgi:tetrahydromethanopterin S-methyltransferase subunit A
MVLKVNSIKKCASEFEKGISLSKCRKCGCMKGSLEEMRNILASVNDQEASELLKKVESWLGKTEPSLYT